MNRREELLGRVQFIVGFDEDEDNLKKYWINVEYRRLDDLSCVTGGSFSSPLEAPPTYEYARKNILARNCDCVNESLKKTLFFSIPTARTHLSTFVTIKDNDESTQVSTSDLITSVVRKD